MRALAFSGLFLAASATAQTVLPPFDTVYQIDKIGSGLGGYGGTCFAPGNPNALLLGTYGQTTIRSLPLTRNGSNQITDFGTPTSVITVGGVDGGLAVGPGNVLFATWYGPNRINQIKPGSVAPDRIDDLGPLGVAGSVGTCAFVPAGLPGAGRFKVCSWSGQACYDLPLTPDANGTYALGAATSSVSVVNGPEGMVYVPLGAPLLGGKLLIAEWSGGVLAAYDIDSIGDPLPATRVVVGGGMYGFGGGAVDPLTGDIVFSSGYGELLILRVGAACGAFTSYGPASPGALGTPTITGAGCARIGQNITIDTTGPSSGIGILAAGYQLNVTYLNLTVLQSLGVTIVSVLSPGGVGTLPLTIPTDPALGFSHLYLQAAYFDPSTSSGLIASAGLDILIR